MQDTQDKVKAPMMQEPTYLTGSAKRLLETIPASRRSAAVQLGNVERKRVGYSHINRGMLESALRIIK